MIEIAKDIANKRFEETLAAEEKRTGKVLLPSFEYETETIEKYFQEEMARLSNEAKL
jgi:hypothetical protein